MKWELGIAFLCWEKADSMHWPFIGQKTIENGYKIKISAKQQLYRSMGFVQLDTSRNLGWEM